MLWHARRFLLQPPPTLTWKCQYDSFDSRVSGRFPDLDTLEYSAGGVPRFEVNNFTRSSSSSSALSCPRVSSIPPLLAPHIVGNCEEGHHCGYHEIGKFFSIQGKLGMGNTLACRKLIQILLWFLRWAIQAMAKPSLTSWNTETWSIAVTQRPPKKSTPHLPETG